jgi:hypothetical protein
VRRGRWAAESREQRAESIEQREESREQRAGSREERAESREQRAESREQGAERREQRAESREQSRRTAHEFIELRGEEMALFPLSIQGTTQLSNEAMETLRLLCARSEIKRQARLG